MQFHKNQQSDYAPRPKRRALAAAVAATLAAVAGDAARADLTHRYSFNGDVVDSINGANGTLNGTGGYVNGTAVNFNGTDTFAVLPAVLPTSGSMTLEFWGTYDSTGGGWERIIDFGNGPDNNFFFTPKSGPGDTRLRLKTSANPNNEQGPLVAGNLANNTPMLLTAVLDSAASTLSLYRDGNLLNTTVINNNLGGLIQSQNYLGKSQYNDPLLKGSLNEFRVYDIALTPKQIALNAILGPDNTAPTGTNDFQTPGAGNWATGTWSLGHVPTNTELVTIANGATVTVDSNVGANPITQVSNGNLVVAAGGALNASIDLAPGNANSAAINVNGGDLTVFSILVDGGGQSGTAAKQVNINGGVLHTVGSFTLSGTNLTSAVGAAGATFDTQATSNVVWGPGLTPVAAGASLTKIGAGSLTLAKGGFEGPVTIRAGALTVSGNVGTSGAALLLGDGNFANGAAATLGFAASGTVLSPITVGTSTTTGAYTLNVAANATVNVPTAVTLNRPLTVTTVATTGTNALNITGGITSGGAGAKALTFNNAGLVNVGTVGISDGGGGTLSVAKNNAGVLILSAPNTYTGGTTINGGGILFAAPATIAGAGRNVTVNAGGVAAAGPAFDYTNLTGTFFNRIVQSSAGVIALTANSAENFNFSAVAQNFTAASLGAATNVTYTGTLTPNGTIYRLGGGGGVLTLPNANAVTGVANSLIVGGAGNGTVVLGGANNYGGGTTLRSGALSVGSAASLGSNAITFTGGTLQVTGADPFASAHPLVFTTGGGTFQIDNTAGATFSGLGINSGAVTANNAPVTKTGPGNLILTGAANVGNNSIWVRNGTLTADGAAVVTSTYYNSIGQLGTDVGSLVVKGNAQYSVAHDFNVGDTENTKGVLFIQDSAIVSAKTFFAGKFNSAQGAVVQTGGTLTNTAAPNEWRIGGVDANAANAVGTYDLSAGTLDTAANYQVGAYGSGAMTVTGGSATVRGYPVAGRFPGSYGVLTVTGGSFSQVNANAGVFLIIGEQGTGILNVSGSGRVNADLGALRIGLAGTGNGIVNLGTGGVIATTAVQHDAGGGSINFHGGTLLANADAPSLLQGIPNAYVYAEGAVFDTNGKNVIVGQSLSDPAAASGSGVASIALATGGTGYVGTPVVKITGGGGDGASAVPVVTGGVVTGIQITNPGTGYTSPATVTILGGGGAGATAGAVNLAPNAAGGGITKVGLGDLVLAGVNTYSGNTVVNVGRIIQGTTGTVPSGAGKGILVVNGGATAGGVFDMNGMETQLNGIGGTAGAAAGQVVNGGGIGSVNVLTVGLNDATATFAGQIVDSGPLGPGAAIALTKEGAGTQTLGGVNTYSGNTVVNAGTLRVTGSIANSPLVFVNAGTFEAAATQTVQKVLLLGGQAKVTGGAAVANASVLTLGNNTGGSTDALVVAPGAKVDLTTNGLVVDVAPGNEAATAADVRTLIVAGRAGGTWAGEGITSSAAALSPSSRAVGYALAGEVLGATGGTFLTKAGVDASGVLVRYTLLGDSDLDGKVGFPDLVAVAQHYDKPSGATWFEGDFDYDGKVGFGDLVAVAQNYDGALPGSAIPGAPANFGQDLAAAFAAAAVPEPSAAASLALVAACGLAARRRRRR